MTQSDMAVNGRRASPVAGVGADAFGIAERPVSQYRPERSPGTVWSASLPSRRSAGEGHQLEQIRRQVVELSAARLAAEERLGALAESEVGRLSDHGGDPALRFGADAGIGQP